MEIQVLEMWFSAEWFNEMVEGILNDFNMLDTLIWTIENEEFQGDCPAVIGLSESEIERYGASVREI